MGAVYDCDECCETWEPDSPPCHDCPLPWIILPESAEAMRNWDKCNIGRGYGVGMSGLIPLKLTPADIRAVCDCDPYPVMIVEQYAYPKILKDHKDGA